MFLKIWFYILMQVKIVIDNIIQADEELYVVYYASVYDDIYLCRNGKHSLELYNTLNKVSMLTNRPALKILYGKANSVFRYKIPKLDKIVFTFNADEEKRREICRLLADVPLLNFKGDKE